MDQYFDDLNCQGYDPSHLNCMPVVRIWTMRAARVMTLPTWTACPWWGSELWELPGWWWPSSPELHARGEDLNYESCYCDDPAPAPLWVVVLPEGGRLAGGVSPEGGDVLVHGVELPLVDAQVAVRHLLLILGGGGPQLSCEDTQGGLSSYHTKQTL